MQKIYSQNELLNELRAMAAKSGQKAVAENLGIVRSTLSDLLNDRLDISERIAEAMGYRREIIFRKAA